MLSPALPAAATDPIQEEPRQLCPLAAGPADGVVQADVGVRLGGVRREVLGETRRGAAGVQPQQGVQQRGALAGMVLHERLMGGGGDGQVRRD